MTESALLRVIIGLVLVVAAILASAWLARRAGLVQRGGGNLLKQVAALPLGARQSVVVIEVDKTWLVVGVSPNQLTTLHTMPAGELPEGACPPRPSRPSWARRSAPPARDPHEFPQTHDLLPRRRACCPCSAPRRCWGWRCSRPASWPRPPCPP